MTACQIILPCDQPTWKLQTIVISPYLLHRTHLHTVIRSIFLFYYVKCILKQDIYLFSNYSVFSEQWVHISKENYDINHGKDDITRRKHVLRDTIHCFCPNEKVGEILILTIFFNIFPDWLHLYRLPRFIFKLFFWFLHTYLFLAVYNFCCFIF